jgi:hypothetical protein
LGLGLRVSAFELGSSEGGEIMTLLEKPEVLHVPEAPARRRFEWTIWVVLAVLIVAGITAGILLTVDREGVSADQVGARLALDNQVAASRIAAVDEATGNDMALEFTSLRVLEEMFPGRLEMLARSAQRADQAMGYSIDRLLGG